MFKIGEFAKLCGTSVKTLHFYDEIGLLRPAQVDKATGYRRYSAEQMPRLAHILMLKEWGFSLDEIGPLLRTPPPPSTLVPLLRQKQTEIAARLQSEQERLRCVTGSLRQLEQASQSDATFLRHTVQIKTVPEQMLAALFLTTLNNDSGRLAVLFRDGFTTIYRALAENHLCPIGAPVVYWGLVNPSTSDNNLSSGEISLGVPLTPGKNGWAEGNIANGGVVPLVLPSVRQMACVLHHGSLLEMASVFDVLVQFLEGSRLQICGPRRDVVLHYGGTEDAANASVQPSVCETQFPVSPL